MEAGARGAGGAESRRAVVLEGVTKTYHRGNSRPHVVLADVALQLEQGQFVSIVGPTGCGNSTLLNLISGIDPPDRGRIVVDGKAVTGIRQDVGYIFQADLLLPWKTVRENIGLALLFRGENAQGRGLVNRWIQRVGLRGFEEYYPHQLSGGMKKRAALAQGLVYNPRVILMDEPFAALDVQTRNLMENELLEIWADLRGTCLFVTHDLEEAIALSDTVVVLTTNPGSVKAVYPIDLPRPRSVVEIRFHPRYREIFEQIWADLRVEVMRAYERTPR
jgi:NitT/TauT family transport system ATP-binding protein